MAKRGARTPPGSRPVADEVLALWEAGMLDVAAAVLEQAKRGDVRSQQAIMQWLLGKAGERSTEDDAGNVTLRIITDAPGPEAGG